MTEKPNRFAYLASNETGEQSSHPDIDPDRFLPDKVTSWVQEIDSQEPHRLLRQRFQPRQEEITLPEEIPTSQLRQNKQVEYREAEIYSLAEETSQSRFNSSSIQNPERSKRDKKNGQRQHRTPQAQKIESRRVKREQKGNGIHGIGPRNSGPEFIPINGSQKPVAKRPRRINIPRYK